MKQYTKEIIFFDYIVPGIVMIALIALMAMVLVMTRPAHANNCPYGYHWQCTSWTGGKSCSCVPN